MRRSLSANDRLVTELSYFGVSVGAPSAMIHDAGWRPDLPRRIHAPPLKKEKSMIGGVTPILCVRDIEASKGFYTNVLGFKVDWEAPYMISVSRDRASLMLCYRHQGHAGTWVWIGVDDVDALHAEFAAKGAVIRDAPQNFNWAYEMQVEDPDRHVLRFGAAPKSGARNGL